MAVNIDTLRYFRAIAEIGSVSKAAGVLHVSQQGLSKSVRSLEEALGAKLFDRTPRGVELTACGRVAYASASRIVAEYDAMVQGVESAASDARALSAEGIQLTASLICISTIIDDMMERGFLEGLSLSQAETDEALLGSVGHDGLLLVDIFSHRHSLEELARDFELMPLFESGLSLIFKRELCPNISGVISPDQAARLPLGLVDTETMRDALGLLFDGVDPTNVRLRTTSEAELVRGVTRGRFATIVPRSFWPKFTKTVKNPDDFVCCDVDCDTSILFAFAKRIDRPMTDEQRRFAESFKRSLRGLRQAD